MVTLKIPLEHWDVIAHILELHCFAVKPNGEIVSDLSTAEEALRRKEIGLQRHQRESKEATDPERRSED
jgi:hypothetical protein